MKEMGRLLNIERMMEEREQEQNLKRERNRDPYSF